MWHTDWGWSLPLIVLTVVIHVFGLGLINEHVFRLLSGMVGRRRFTAAFVLVMGIVALLVTTLHAIEGAAWAIAYRVLGALLDGRSAMLYSFGAMTSYG